jgi:large conductance mechanosensitive channel
MGFLKDFKTFATKGNLADVAIAFLIGTAFGKFITSFVDGLISPILGILTGGTNFNALQYVYKDPQLGADGKAIAGSGVIFKYGAFFGEFLNFMIVVLVCYLVIKNLLKKDPNAAPAPTPSESLLAEIRDSLKK